MKKTIIKVSVATLAVIAAVLIFLTIKDAKDSFIFVEKHPTTCTCLQHIKKKEEKKHKYININCGYVKHEGKFLARNKIELQKIQKLNNCDLSSFAKDDVHYMNDNYIYFVEFVNTSTSCYSISAYRFNLCNEYAYFYIFDESEYDPFDKVYTTDMNGFCFIAMIPIDEIDNKNIPLTDYQDKEGNIWYTDKYIDELIKGDKLS